MATLPADNGGWVLLGERAHDEIALGLVGRYWRPVIESADMPAPEAFRDFAEGRTKPSGQAPAEPPGSASPRDHA